MPTSDEDWFLELLCDPQYAKLNLESELDAMHRWCEDHERTPTRKMFLGWIGRAEPELKLARRKRRAPEPAIDIYREPSGWRSILASDISDYDRWILSEPWSAIRCTHGRRIWLAVLARQEKG